MGKELFRFRYYTIICHNIQWLIVDNFSYDYGKKYMKETPFSKKVYEIVKKISRGKTLTYKEVAKLAGRPKAFRAVGNILSKNYDDNIPCHRVIRSDGKTGGYNRGKERKARILKEESLK